jgi:hypothetical protein
MSLLEARTASRSIVLRNSCLGVAWTLGRPVSFRISYCARVLIRRTECFDCCEWGYPRFDAACIRCRHFRPEMHRENNASSSGRGGDLVSAYRVCRPPRPAVPVVPSGAQGGGRRELRDQRGTHRVRPNSRWRTSFHGCRDRVRTNAHDQRGRILDHRWGTAGLLP